MKVKVKFLKDHGTAKKGDEREMYESTAVVLERVKIVSIDGKKAKAEEK